MLALRPVLPVMSRMNETTTLMISGDYTLGQTPQRGSNSLNGKRHDARSNVPSEGADTVKRRTSRIPSPRSSADGHGARSRGRSAVVGQARDPKARQTRHDTTDG